jgi:biopolymer transport protein ExbD
MKSSLYAIAVFFLLLSCTKGNKIEDQLYERTVAEYKKEGIELEPLLDKIEAQFIKEGILTGKGGLAKVKYYERLAAGKEMKGLKNLDVIQPIVEHPMTSGFLDRAKRTVMDRDSIAYVSSDFVSKMQRIQRRAVKNGDISRQSASQATIDVLTAEDFEQPFYRMFMLLTVVRTIDTHTAFNRKNPEPTEQARPTYNSENTIDIRLKEDHELLINGEEYTIDDFEKVFYATYDKIGSLAEINLYVSPMSPYGDFAFIQSVIEAYMYDVRSKEAQHSFHKAYDALSNSQKQQVNEAHPLRMIEIPYK